MDRSLFNTNSFIKDLSRAYLNDRLDLTEAEGLIDLINAQTEQQRKQSLYQMQGSLKELYERWRVDLVKSLAHAEAYIDFHEDQHIEHDILIDGKNNDEHLNTLNLDHF